MGFLDKFKKKKAAPPRKAGPETENYTSGGSAVCRYEARENRGFRPPEDVRVSMGALHQRFVEGKLPMAPDVHLPNFCKGFTDVLD